MKFTIRASLCAVTVLARRLSNRPENRRQTAPSAESVCDSLIAASFGAWRTRFSDRLVLADSALPPLIFVPPEFDTRHPFRPDTWWRNQ